MKFLVLLVVLVVAYLWWRNSRLQQHRGRPDAGAPPAAGGPVQMVRCADCGVHLPQTDALPGPGGRFYCCQEHRQHAGG